MEKLEWYERMGIGEVLVIGRDDRSVRQWTRDLEGFAERTGEDGWFNLSSLEGVRIHAGDLSVQG